MKNYTITVNGNVYEVTVKEGAFMGAAPAARAITPAPKAALVAVPKAVLAGAAGSVVVPAPTSGKILGVKAAVGQTVKKGDVVVVLGAMKAESKIVTPSDGTVASVNASAGDPVEANATLVTLDQDNAS